MPTDNRKGFSGLDSLETKEADLKVETNASGNATHQPAEPVAPQPPNRVIVDTVPVSDQPPLWKQKWLWWVIGIGAVILFANYDSKPSPKSTGYTPSVSSSSSLTESRPTGTGDERVLSASEIYYCLAEEARLGATNSALNPYDGAAIERFNSYVRDYNFRCGAYKYRQSDMNRAKRALEENRFSIELQGINRF